MLSLIIVIVCGLLEWKQICTCFFIGSLYYLYCRWRSNYQDGECWDPINLFNPATFLCLSQVRDWISIGICCDSHLPPLISDKQQQKTNNQNIFFDENPLTNDL
jgi:hypothetical protein